MVFGNMGDDCATGVCLHPRPVDRREPFYGEYLVNAQGEDVVAGIRTPQPDQRGQSAKREPTCRRWKRSCRKCSTSCASTPRWKRHYRDMQDIEFTVEGKLWMLQTRTGKRTARRRSRIACEMVDEGLIERPRPVRRVDPASLDQLLHPMLDPTPSARVIGRGLPASPGAASGQGRVHRRRGRRMAAAAGERHPGAHRDQPRRHPRHARARGILTTRGGMTSHAAVVARGMGKPCVAGAGDLHVDYKAGTF
jgi:pyruvate,orthophosphate dikinase